MDNSGLLLKQFFKKPTRIGALCPSGEALCREMVAEIGMEQASTVAELGPGTGVITREILRTMPDGGTFFAVELDDEIFRNFQAVFPNVTVFNESAENLTELMAQQHLRQLDAVISGLPWAAFPAALQNRILDAVLENLKSGGYFTTFAYLQGLLLPAGVRFRHLLHSRFPEVRMSRVVWRNLPPAVVYRCQKA